MANIGVLGSIVFAVSSRQIRTFDSLQWGSSARYAEHDRHLRSTLLEFTGIDADDMSFDMYFSVFLNVNPQAEINRLLLAERNGLAMRLVIGRRVYGRNRWVILNTDKTLEKFDGRGNLLVARVNVKLKEYLRRGNR